MHIHKHLPLIQALPIEKREATFPNKGGQSGPFRANFACFFCKNKHTKSTLLGRRAKKNFDREGVGIKEFWFVKIILNFFGSGDSVSWGVYNEI